LWQKNLLKRQKDFLAQIDEGHSYDTLFDCIEGLSFFVKNTHCEIMKANKSLLQHLGFKTEDDLIGKTDFELFPKHLAEQYRMDDLEVIHSGQPKLKIIEYFTNELGILDWFITHKMPVFSRAQTVIGVMGIIQSYHRADQLVHASSYISNAVDIIQEQYKEKITIEDLSKQCNLSQRQLHRHFIQELGMSPQNFLIRTRIQAACKKLKADPHSALSNAALDAGFYDQTSFTKHFKKCMGITPLQFQKRFRL